MLTVTNTREQILFWQPNGRGVIPVVSVVQKFMKILMYQKIDEAANKLVSAVASRISRVEWMEGHARAGDWRRKYFPEGEWPFEAYDQKCL